MNTVTDSLIEAVRSDAQKYFDLSRGSHGMDHTERVYRLALRLGEIEGADLSVLKLAALLHDTGRLQEDTSKGRVCHAERGAEIAGEILGKYDLDGPFIDRVAGAIATHRFRGEHAPETLEAEVLFDADKLDSIGAAGIGRAFLFAGEVGARLHNSSIDVEKTQAYTIEDTAYREFMVKLRFVKDRMCTAEGKRLARERHSYMIDFFKRLDREVEGEI